MKKQFSILVIEDDPWFAEQHSRVLIKAGFDVRHAPDGVIGMQLLDEAVSDVVVLDVFLPGPNALVLLHEIQSYSDLSKIPVILCTGSAAELSLAAVAPYGVVEVLDKTLMQPEDVVRAARRTLL